MIDLEMTNIVGEIMGDCVGLETGEQIMAELEAFMIRHGIDRIDVSWKRPRECERCGHDSITGNDTEDELTGEPLSDQNAAVIGTADGPIGKKVADLVAGNELAGVLARINDDRQDLVDPITEPELYGQQLSDVMEAAGEEQLPLASGVERDEALEMLDGVTAKMDARSGEALEVRGKRCLDPDKVGDAAQTFLITNDGDSSKGPCLDPDKMHGACDGFVVLITNDGD